MPKFYGISAVDNPTQRFSVIAVEEYKERLNNQNYQINDDVNNDGSENNPYIVDFSNRLTYLTSIESLRRILGVNHPTNRNFLNIRNADGEIEIDVINTNNGEAYRFIMRCSDLYIIGYRDINNNIVRYRDKEIDYPNDEAKIREILDTMVDKILSTKLEVENTPSRMNPENNIMLVYGAMLVSEALRFPLIQRMISKTSSPNDHPYKISASNGSEDYSLYQKIKKIANSWSDLSKIIRAANADTNIDISCLDATAKTCTIGEASNIIKLLKRV